MFAGETWCRDPRQDRSRRGGGPGETLHFDYLMVGVNNKVEIDGLYDGGHVHLSVLVSVSHYVCVAGFSGSLVGGDSRVDILKGQ